MYIFLNKYNRIIISVIYQLSASLKLFMLLFYIYVWYIWYIMVAFVVLHSIYETFIIFQMK